MKKNLAVLLSAALLLSGCSKPPDVKVVSQISVDWEQSDGAVDRVYTDPYKMQRVLNRMRQLGQRFSPELDPEGLKEPSVTITVAFNDGSHHRHQVKADRYIRTDNRLWQQTDPKQIQRLQFLLKALPGDEA